MSASFIFSQHLVTSSTNQIAVFSHIINQLDCLLHTTVHAQSEQNLQSMYGCIKCSHMTPSTNQIAAFGHMMSSPLNQSDCSTPLRMHNQNQKYAESLWYSGVKCSPVTSSTNQIVAFDVITSQPIRLFHTTAHAQPEPEVCRMTVV